MKKVMTIFGAVIFSSIILQSCSGDNSVKITPKSKKVQGDFDGYFEIASQEIKLNPENNSNKINVSVSFKGIKACPGCEYKEMQLAFYDEAGSILGSIPFIRNEGEQIERMDRFIQNGSGEQSLNFSGNQINGGLSKEKIEIILKNSKTFSLESKALIIPNAGDLLIGKEMHGGIVFSADEKGEHGIVVCKEDISTEADWKNAKKICESYSNGGFEDWKLPTKSEMEMIYKNLSPISIELKNNLEDAYYWTETIYNQNFGTTWPYSFDFSRGESDHNKGEINKFHVRAIRKF